MVLQIKMAITVTLEYDPVWIALQWAKEHLSSYITNKAVCPSGPTANYLIAYSFGEEEDAMMFHLKYGGRIDTSN